MGSEHQNHSIIHHHKAALIIPHPANSSAVYASLFGCFNNLACKEDSLVDKCKKEMIYCCFIYSPSISPLSSPPHLHHCTEGRFFNFLHENNAIAFLASPAKQASATHGDRWPPIIAECLIDPGRAQCVCLCLRVCARACGWRLTSVMHVMCAAPR